MSNNQIKSPCLDGLNDREILQARLEWEGYTEIKVKSDGNCQFRALAHQLYKTPDLHKRVRHEILQELKSRPKLYKGSVLEEFSRYVKKMSNDFEWGDEVTLRAAANLYGVKIIVLTSMKNVPFLVNLPKSEKEPGRTIHLSYLAGIHYNSIHLNEGSDIASIELQKKKNNNNKKKKNKDKEKPTINNYQKKLNHLSDDMSMPLEGEEEEQQQQQEQDELHEKEEQEREGEEEHEHNPSHIKRGRRVRRRRQRYRLHGATDEEEDEKEEKEEKEEK